MGFFGGWSTVPGIKDLNNEVDALEYGPRVRAAGEGRVKKDAGRILKGGSFWDTGLGGGIKQGIMSDFTNENAVRRRNLGAMYSGTGMYNDAFKNAMMQEEDRKASEALQDRYAKSGMEGSQYLIGLNRSDRRDQQDYNNAQSQFDLSKLGLRSNNLLQGTQRTGGILGNLMQLGNFAAGFTPGGALAKLGSSAINGFTAGR